MDVLQRHNARRASGIPTVTVLVGPAGAARRLWTAANEPAGTPLLDGTADPHADLRGWIDANRHGLRRAILHRLARRTGREPDGFLRDWFAKSQADAEAFWNTLEPEPGDDLLRHALAEAAEGFPAEQLLPRLIGLDLPGFRWPSLFGIANSPTMLIPWGAFAERFPKLPVAVGVTADVWSEFGSKPPTTRAEAILREGEVAIPALGRDEVARRLAVGGLPEPAAEALAQTADDVAFVEEVVAAFRDHAAAPATKEDDDKARSAAERYVFARLEDLDETRGRFRQNEVQTFSSGRTSEIDLICHDPKVAIEIDGYFHFRNDQDYRNDREKDWELQRLGYVVLRFLAGDATRHWDVVRDRIFAALQRKSP
jgi:very-short-patch-repair endonuclease